MATFIRATCLTDRRRAIHATTPLSKLFFDKTTALSDKREHCKKARPGELLGAALDLFVEKGFAANRAEDVAARASASKGTLFLCFQSKEEILKAVVRENIPGRFTEWRSELDVFEGTTPELRAYCMTSWWERVDATRASGITKLMMSETKNFPEVAAFYQQEVIQPGQALIRCTLQRGMDRGKFGPVDLQKYIAFQVQTILSGINMPAHGAAAELQKVAT